MNASEALQKLKRGNQAYLTAKICGGDVSPELRAKTCAEGQNPYAIVVTCSDSRVIPEAVFSAGIGELFVIRVAGNVIDNHQLGSIEYAAGHLGSRLVVVMGHDHCGAVGAAINHDPEGYIKFITDEIRVAIGGERDETRACCLNVRRSVRRIKESLDLCGEGENDLQVVGALYRLETGEVEFLSRD